MRASFLALQSDSHLKTCARGESLLGWKYPANPQVDPRHAITLLRAVANELEVDLPDGSLRAIAAARRYPVNRLEERITTAAKRSSALSDAWQKCR